MPRIGARSDLTKSSRYIKENLGKEANEKLAAKIAERQAKRTAAKQIKTLKAQELHRMAQARRQSFLERTPSKDILERQLTAQDIAEMMALG